MSNQPCGLAAMRRNDAGRPWSVRSLTLRAMKINNSIQSPTHHYSLTLLHISHRLRERRETHRRVHMIAQCGPAAELR